MTNARKLAREAADDLRNASSRRHDIADAVSDIWEPLLQDLVSAVEQEFGKHAWDPALSSSESALRRAKKALGA